MNERMTTEIATGRSAGADRTDRETTLTDRYVWAVVRELPVEQRADIETELRGLIEDMIDDGRPERDVLVDLGDPTRLAARYRGSPRSLIGPELYPHWLRTTRQVASIVVPLVGVGALIGGIIADDGAVEIVANALWVALIALVNVGFWSTLGFAIAERNGERLAAPAWTPGDLAAVPARSRPGLGETISSATVALTVAALLVTQHVRGLVSGPDGEAVPLIDPNAWNGRAQVIVAALVAGAVVAVLARRMGWTAPLVAANLIANILLASMALWLAASGEFINAAFFEAIDADTRWRNTATTSGWVAAVLTVAIAVVDSVESTVRWRRQATS
jgi:uncharacterized membrane protein